MQQQQNTNMGQMGQNVMPEPPAVLTSKDHLYITDMLSWNLLAMKKAHFYANHCQDKEVVQALENVGKMHQKHYETILKQLNKQGQGQLQ